MKARTSQEFPEDVAQFEEETDDLEAWMPQDLDPFDSLGASRIADLAD